MKFTLIFLLFIIFNNYSYSSITNVEESLPSTSGHSVEKQFSPLKNTTDSESGSGSVFIRQRALSPRKDSCDCGRRNLGVASRIVGGSKAGKNEFPWRCSIFARFRSEYSVNDSVLAYGYKFYCGCTILSDKWVMTAAHCAYEDLFQGTAHVFAGDHRLSPPEAGTGQLIPVKRIHYHPHYDNDTSDNDIALLELERKLKLGVNVKPICLPYKFKKNKFYKQTATVSGWGLTKYREDKSSQDLRKADLSVLTTKQCRKFFKTFPVNVTDNMFCTYTPKKDTCQGDSGGSLDYEDPETGKYFAIGIVSWGIGCAFKDIPGVYTKVAKYLTFLGKTSGENFCSVR